MCVGGWVDGWDAVPSRKEARKTPDRGRLTVCVCARVCVCVCGWGPTGPHGAPRGPTGPRGAPRAPKVLTHLWVGMFFDCFAEAKYIRSRSFVSQICKID